jgi:hypothetical protein
MTPKAIFGPNRAPRSIRSICAQVLPRLHQPVVDYSDDAAAASPSPAAVAPLQPFRAPRHCLPAARAIRRPRRAPRLLVTGCTGSTTTSSCTTSTRLHSPGCSDLPQLRRASGCLGTSHGSSRGSSRRSSSTTPGSSSTTSPPPRVRMPQHVAWLVTRLITLLVVDYSGLVVDYFTSAARPGASARRAARHMARHMARRVARRATRRRLLRLHRASGCLGTSRGPSRGSSSTTPCVATSSCGHTGSTSATLCVATTCLTATLALLRVCRAPP